MWWSRLLRNALAATLVVGLAPGAGGGFQTDQEGSSSTLDAGSSEEPAVGEPASDQDTAAPDPAQEKAQDEKRKAKRKAKREPEPGEDEQKVVSGEEPPKKEESAGDSESEEETKPEPELPGALAFESDADCYFYVDGVLVGTLSPDQPFTMPVELGEFKIRATSMAVPGAVWEKTIELEEPGEQAVRIKMERAIRLFRLEERKTGVFRDPKSSLMWPKKDNGQDVDLRRAYAHCRDLETGGYDDWRLPLLEELKSLESIWHRGTYKIRGAILLTECCMWSSEYDGSERAWTFNYRFRQAFQANAGYAIGLRALCVREWSPETETGQKGAEAEGGEPGAELGDG